MIIVQTPLRVSFFGGGTDFRSYYFEEGGCVLSSSIDKYIYITIKDRFDDLIRVGYTQTEMVESLDDLNHELIREALKVTSIRSGVEITTMGDIPSAGSGLGSSSTVTVGSLHAMYTYIGELTTASVLARQACEIEIDRLRKPIGVQDQYIVAYGGLRFIEFNIDGKVVVNKVSLSTAVRRKLNENLLLFYTGISRKADNILVEQKNNIQDKRIVLRKLKGMAKIAKNELEAGNVDVIGELLHESWQLKKNLASQISNSTIDEMYDAARRAGAMGGKITGAGGGGFLLLYCPHEFQDSVRESLSDLQELPFQLDESGSKVIFNYRR